MTLLKTVHAFVASFRSKAVACSPVIMISRLVGAAVVCLLSAAIPPASAQQLRSTDVSPKAREGHTRIEPGAMLPDMTSGESNPELAPRRERRVRWLKSANGSLSLEADTGRGREGGRMSGLSREERHRLRSDIREAGFTAYSPGTSQGLLPIQPEFGTPGNISGQSR